MSRPPDFMFRVSERLSEVMDDIGVNDRLVKERRTAWLLMENIATLTSEYEINNKTYHFGSQIEGSTTIGLNSDQDILTTTENIIQDMSEWKPEVVNLMMIQQENISPGYCYALCIRRDLPLPSTVSDIDNGIMKFCVTDGKGRFLLKNTFITGICDEINFHGRNHVFVHGPALTSEKSGIDIVHCFYCESLPHQVTSWLQKQRGCKWPTEDVLEKCGKSGCFVVPVGSKVAYEPDLEWRISTSLQERYLMFSLNITQLRCYILMKMILKTHIDPYVEDVLSSYMCKNVLWYCIANSSQDWHTGNLLSYLHLCLFMLKECVEQRNCPHFMIPENNLLAGCMTDKQREDLLDLDINNLTLNDEQFLFDIQIDDLGMRLMMKLTKHEVNGQDISRNNSFDLLYCTAAYLSAGLSNTLFAIADASLDMAQKDLFKLLSTLKNKQVGDNKYRRTACALIPLVSSTYGSVLASSDIARHTAISEEAFNYLEAGKETDALSGRLKLVSVLYCTGDMKVMECELRNIQKLNNKSLVETVCTCIAELPTKNDQLVWEACAGFTEVSIKSHVVLCTRFLQCEINIVPHELRYEILGLYTKRQMTTDDDSKWLWLVDSIPYYYFLQYKTYGHLQRRTEEQEALFNLAQSINFEREFGHTDTTLNLLGQCYEQENRQTEAFQCYRWSLKHRRRHNAASFLLCLQLFKLWKQDNMNHRQNGPPQKWPRRDSPDFKCC